MVDGMSKAIRSFYDRSIFDRIIIYLFLSEFLVKVIFELILGQWSFVQSQNKQWFFYSFIALDYLVSMRKIIAIRFPLNLSTVFALLLIIMCGQALIVGILHNNKPFTIFNDAVPLLVMSFNILRMQSVSETRTEPDLDFILRSCLLLAAGCSFAGLLGESMGLMTQPSIGQHVVFLPLIAAAIFKKTSLSRWMLVLAVTLLALSIEDLNRSSLAFMAITAIAYSFAQIIKSPAKGTMTIALTALLLVGATLYVPENAKTYKRVVGLSEVDLSKRTGSIGERQAEQDAVTEKLDRLGIESEFLGLGLGGVYAVKATHTFVSEYGHAHYGWVWFNLRFGMVGYLYLFVMVSILTLIGLRSFFLNSANGYFVGFLCLISIIYVFTYVNAIFLLCGVTFMYLKNSEYSR